MLAVGPRVLGNGQGSSQRVSRPQAGGPQLSSLLLLPSTGVTGRGLTIQLQEMRLIEIDYMDQTGYYITLACEKVVFYVKNKILGLQK